MSKIRDQLTDFRRGLNTSTPVEGGPMVFRNFRDVRTDSGGARRRPGYVRRLAFTSAESIIDFDGSNDKVTFPNDSRWTRLHTFPTWTIEGLSICDSLASTRTILSIGTNLVITQDSTSSGRVVASVVDASAATSTLSVTSIAASTKIDWRLSYDQASTTLTLDVNGTSTTATPSNATLATMSDPLVVGANASAANFFDGRAERITFFSVVKSRSQDCRSRILYPRSPSVLFDAVFNTTDFIRDRGPFESIGAITGSPATTSTLLANNPMPILGIAFAQATDGTRKSYVNVAGVTYPVLPT